jgi:hypothetical protein
MVSFLDAIDIPNLGSVSTNLGKLSVDVANGCLGLGGTSPIDFL